MIVRKGDIAKGAVTAKALANAAVQAQGARQGAVHAKGSRRAVNGRALATTRSLRRPSSGIRHTAALAPNAVTSSALAPGSVYGGA